jgi:hypothetical protein
MGSMINPEQHKRAKDNSASSLNVLRAIVRHRVAEACYAFDCYDAFEEIFNAVINTIIKNPRESIPEIHGPRVLAIISEIWNATQNVILAISDHRGIKNQIQLAIDIYCLMDDFRQKGNQQPNQEELAAMIGIRVVRVERALDLQSFLSHKTLEKLVKERGPSWESHDLRSTLSEMTMNKTVLNMSLTKLSDPTDVKIVRSVANGDSVATIAERFGVSTIIAQVLEQRAIRRYQKKWNETMLKGAGLGM